MECSRLDFKVIANIHELAYGCPTCQKRFTSGYFAIELSCCGENKLVCDMHIGLVNCCQKTYPVPLVFNYRADAEKFIDDAKNGKITNINLTALEFVTKVA